MNKLWLLKPMENLPHDNDPWEPWYDKAFGFVVSAPDAATARRIANDEGGDENTVWGTDYTTMTERNVWLDPALSTCIELVPGVTHVVMKDFHSA